jgi:hypothetical protein
VKRTFTKLAGSRAEQIGRISLDKNDFTIAADGNLVVGLVNGYKVVDADMYQDPQENILKVMATLIAKAYTNMWNEDSKINIYEGEWDSSNKYPSKNYMNNMVDLLKSYIGSDVVILHKVENPNPTIINTPTISLNKGSILNNLKKYTEQLEDLTKIADRLQDKSEAVTRTKFVKTIWGIDKVIEEINAVKKSMPEVEKAVNELGTNVSLSVKALARLQHRVETNTVSSNDDIKFVFSVLIPDILLSFDKIKNAVIKIVTILNPLYNIERIFKQHTGNPSNWSVPGNLVDDIKEAFSVLVEFLVDIPTIEMDVMEPIEVLKARLATRFSSK